MRILFNMIDKNKELIMKDAMSINDVEEKSAFISNKDKELVSRILGEEGADAFDEYNQSCIRDDYKVDVELYLYESRHLIKGLSKKGEDNSLPLISEQYKVLDELNIFGHALGWNLDIFSRGTNISDAFYEKFIDFSPELINFRLLKNKLPELICPDLSKLTNLDYVNNFYDPDEHGDLEDFIYCCDENCIKYAADLVECIYKYLTEIDDKYGTNYANLRRNK